MTMVKLIRMKRGMMNEDEHERELPADIMLDIFSRMPIKSLARFKCVSKRWCNSIDEPHLSVIHTEEPIPLQFYSDETFSRDPRKNPVFEFHSNRFFAKFSSLPCVRGSCYGLILFEIEHGEPHDYDTSLIVAHPLRKETCELPPIDTSLISSKPIRESHGLGFDHSTNTFKIVKVLLMKKVPSNDVDLVRQNSRVMVHVLGTRSWREIPNVPSYPLAKDHLSPIFAHGFLYWFMSPFEVLWDDKKVICFDVTKEEFGYINPPKKRQDSICFIKPFELNGDLGVAYNLHCENLIEVWVMKEKVWKIHCQIGIKPPRPYNYFAGIWNKDGDILVQSGESAFVFDLKTGVQQTYNIVDVQGYSSDIYMYTASLFSIDGITQKPH